MNGDKLIMSNRERERLMVMDRVNRKELTKREGSEIMSISYRQTLRINRRYEEEGAKGLLHRNRGISSNRKKAEEFREKVIRSYEEKYRGFGPTLASEKLEEEGYKVDHETLRRWLIKEGYWEKKRKRKKHRNRRERKEHFGEMVQLDGSPHRWFEDRGEEHNMMNMVDDATGTSHILMSERETTRGAMMVLWQWVEKYGIPKSLYVDRHSIYAAKREPTLKEQLQGEKPMTHFGRACDKLGIKIIVAHTPQAKGRVERKNGVHQDRFVKEMRLLNISSIEEANKLLQNSYIDKDNKKFARKPASEVDYHRPVPEGLDLRAVFCCEEERVISNDWVIRYDNRLFQIKKNNRIMPPAKRKVTVCKWLDGSLHITYRGNSVEYSEINTLPAVKSENKPKPIKKYIPAPDHPWRTNVGRGSTSKEQRAPLSAPPSLTLSGYLMGEEDKKEERVKYKKSTSPISIASAQHSGCSPAVPYPLSGQNKIIIEEI